MGILHFARPTPPPWLRQFTNSNSGRLTFSIFTQELIALSGNNHFIIGTKRIYELSMNLRSLLS